MDQVTDRLCEAIAEIGFEDLPATTVAAAKRVLLDATGVIYAASELSGEADAFIKLAALSPGPCTLLGTGLTAALAQAAFANGALAHALDFEDAFDPAPGHPNASLVPALLATAQHEGGIDGRRFIAALVVGCEVSCRIALALDCRMEEGGWYPPPITAGLGAAVGAGHLLGLGPKGLRDCISLALCQVTMPGEIKHSGGTVLRAVREAFPAQAAVQSAYLAKAGVAGFETPLEGKGGFYALYADGRFDPHRLAGDLGKAFLVERLTFKAWPSCRGTHPFIEMALALREEIGDARTIERIVAEVSPVQRMLVEPLVRKRSPDVIIDAKFSIPFTLALALHRGQVTLDDFDSATLRDDEVLALASRVDCEIVDNSRVDAGAGGALNVWLSDGTVLRRECVTALGDPDRPLGDEVLRAKFVDCTRRARKARDLRDIDTLADEILALETCEDVGALFA